MSDRWKPGQLASARKLNRHSAVLAPESYAGAPGSMATMGPARAALSFDMVNTGMWIRVFDEAIRTSEFSAANETYQYSWEAIWWDNAIKRWRRHENSYGHIDGDPVTCTDYGQLDQTTEAAMADDAARSGVKPHFAVRDPVSRRLVVARSGTGGTFTAKSTETVLMILGTYEQYKDCPEILEAEVPPPPMTYYDYPCSTERTETLCVPAYAYAVYQRCGYEWHKIGDTVDYRVWATEINGGSTSAFRRFHIPRWGGDFDPTDGLPDPESSCIGVAFLPASGSALTCSCPPCIEDIACLAVRFRTPPRPTSPAECSSSVAAMDAANAWDKEFTIELSSVGCNFSGVTDDGIFAFDLQFVDGASLSCDWGPDVFDPCDPCEHWGRLYGAISVDGPAEANCGGAGVWRGEWKASEVCQLACDCDQEIAPVEGVLCEGCGNVTPPKFYFVIPESIKLICCPDPLSGKGESMGGFSAAAYSISAATATALTVTAGGTADASYASASAASPNAGSATAGSSAAVYKITPAAATAGSATVGSSGAIDSLFDSSFEDL